MGGFGSGRPAKQDCTDNCRSIDVRYWQREGLIKEELSFTSTWTRNGESIGSIKVYVQNHALIWLYYSCRINGGNWQTLHYPVTIQTTACNYGGVRYWFTCPSDGCGRSIAVLYLGENKFVCRHCHKVAYPSQRETAGNRAIRRADKIRETLQWTPGILNGKEWKPKGMHWKTYKRLEAEHDKQLDNARAEFVHQFGRF